MRCTASLRRAATVVALAWFFATTPVARGAPVFGEQFTLPQPDGTLIEVRIWGDEYYGVTESLDGYTLVRDPRTLFFCYARLSDDGNDLVSTGVPVGGPLRAAGDIPPHLRIRPESSTAKALTAREQFEQQAIAVMGGQRALRGPTTGAVQGITLIIQFPDVAGTIPPATVNNYCNQVSYTGYGNNGSVRDYFYDVSDARLTYTNYVPSAYYTAAHNRSYYTDPAIPYGTRARELIIEALNALNNSGFDFSLYDADHNGTVDALNCFYAGDCVNNWAEGLWPHAWSVSWCADGVCTSAYQITNMGSSLTLSTFCHENGHMLMGWPDLYDYDYDSSGVGRFCIMCYGTSDTNPPEPCAYMKYVAGWTTTNLLTTPQAGLPVPASNVNTIYKYNHPTKSYEYYLIENRQRTGRDVGLPDDGLAIWHVDTTGSNNNQQMTPSLHYQVTLVQADGRWDLEHYANYGDTTDLWAAPAYVNCTPATVPNTNWWAGNSSALHVLDISASGANMTFRFGNAADCNGNLVPDDQDIASGTSQDCNGNAIPDECDTAPSAPHMVNTAPAVVGYVGISGTGTPLNLTDDSEADVIMPFTTSLFSVSTVRVANNGGIGFLSGGDLSDSNATLPTTSAFGGAQSLLAFWDDIDSDTGNVYYRTIGTAPNRTFIVEWYNRPHFSGDAVLDGDEVTFQIQMFETPTAGVHAQFLYADTNFLNASYDNGASATVGYQLNGSDGSQWSYNQAVITPAVVLSLSTAGTSPDCNGNTVPDECELDCNANGRPDVCDAPGDLDGDGTVTAADWPAVAACMSGVCEAPPCDPPVYGPGCCELADFDADGDVDLSDVGMFQATFPG